MTVQFIPVKDDTTALKASIMIGGGSGSGKTLSALLIARGLANGGPIGVIDTENERAKHYRDDFPEMMHYDFQPGDDGFTPERYIEAVEAAEKAGVPVLVIDSLSHAHEGIGGILERQEMELDRMAGQDSRKREALSQLAWAKVKPVERRLVDRLIRAKCHVILCARAKPMITDRNGKPLRKNKLRRDDLPWDLAINKDIIFETTVTVIMDPENPGVPIPIKTADRFKAMFSGAQRMSVETGKELLAWSKGSSADTSVYDDARAAARKGADALAKHWKGLSQADRVLVSDIQSELEQLRDAAEAAKSDQPFGKSAEPDDDPLERLFKTVLQEVKDGADPTEIADLYGPQLDQMRQRSPDMAKALSDAGIKPNG